MAVDRVEHLPEAEGGSARERFRLGRRWDGGGDGGGGRDGSEGRVRGLGEGRRGEGEGEEEDAARRAGHFLPFSSFSSPSTGWLTVGGKPLN